MLMMLLAFVVTIVVIVAIHEYGHYLAMRLFNVRVLTFSIGFGPRLMQWRNKAGTDFVISAIPLGGYVKPLDRRDCDVVPAEENQEFSGKPPWQRIITYAAGPVANFLLAIAIYWLVLLGGQASMAPLVGEVKADTAAERAGLRYGDEILKVEGRATGSWQQLGMTLMRFAGEDRYLSLLLEDERGNQRQVQLAIRDWSHDPEQPALPVLGIVPLATLPVVGKVTDESAARRAGLREGDRILAIDGEPLDSWRAWVDAVQASPDQPMTLDVVRGDRQLLIDLVPDAVEQQGERIGRAGVAAPGLREVSHGPLEAIPLAGERLWQQTSMIFSAIGKMLTGTLSWQTLGGPITIAQVAGETASMGVMTFLLFLAFFSVSLGVINLLPIPMLDGGWILFGLIEMLRGKALPERFLVVAQSFGITLVFCLMMLAIFNDVMRQFS